MKFHRIEIENINSLYGEQILDLEHEFKDVPLYLIMGPTGSGKTTILDAICLALFGETPRQCRAGASSIAALVSSHGTVTSRALVEFSLLDTAENQHTRYRAVWAFRRAHKDPNGTPQPPRRELHRRNVDGQWESLVSSDKLKYYVPEFERVLGGMKLEDFLRSVMLAQGEFAALLSAKTGEKAAILERLTDTEDFETLGRLAHERWQKERDAYQALKEQVEHMEGASAEDLQRVEDRLERGRQDLEKLQACRDYVARRRDWLRRRGALVGEVAEAGEQLKLAEQAREAREADFMRLARDARVQPARAPLHELRRLQAEEKAAREALPALLEAVEARKTDAKSAEAGEKAAVEALRATESASEAARPLIQEAKEAELSQKNAAHQAGEAQKKVEQCQAAVDASAARLKAAEAELDAATAARVSAEQKLAEVADGAEIDQKLPAIELKYSLLAPARTRAGRAGQKLEKIRAYIGQKTADMAAIDAKIETLRAQSRPLEKALDAAKNTLEAELGDADRLRERRDAIEARRQKTLTRKAALKDLLDLVEKRFEKSAALQEILAAQRVGQAQIDAFDARLAAEGASRNALVIRRDEVEAELERLHQELLAAELRKNLHQGQDCPVCGAQEHPRLAGDDADTALSEREQADQAEQARLEQARADIKAQIAALDEALKEIERDKNAAAMKLAKTRTRLDLGEEALEVIDAEIEKVAQQAGQSAEMAGLEREAFESAYEKARHALDAEINELEAQKKRLDLAEDEVGKAEEALKDTAQALEKAAQQKRDAAHALQMAGEQVAGAEADRDEIAAEIAELRRALSALLSALGVEVDAEAEPAPGAGADEAFDQAVAGLKARLKAWQAARDALAEAERAAQKAQVARDQVALQRTNDQAQWEGRQKECAAALEQLKACRARLDDYVAQLGGQGPDAAQAAHDRALKAARAARDAAGSAHQKARSVLQRAEDAHSHAKKSLEELGEKLRQAGAALDEAVAQIGAEDAELGTRAQVEAALLEDAERRALKADCDKIDLALRDARRDAERVAQALESHEADRPTDFEAERYTLAGLDAAEAQICAAVDTQNQAIGRLRNEVEVMRKNFESRKALLAEFEAQRLVYEGWHELNSLIGTGRGAAFKEFAQALHLDRIVARANYRLRELHPRYLLCTRLDKDSRLPTLDFEIMDKYTGGKRRPISTLSGGETFLISLALALALADQQQIKMPMETLFLDEGFGTLDRQSLQTAMGTLKRLHARVGRTVAVISHVEALRGEIPHQVVVKPLTEGRSKAYLTTKC